MTIALCVLLGLYAVFAWRIPRFQLRGDQAGDNCYYLGFLFTLISLALSLAAFTKADTAEGGAMIVVEDFGIALASTIVGLVLRVCFNQRRKDPVAVIEHGARLRLAEAAQRLRAELDQSVLETNHYRRAMRQSIEEANTETDKLVTKALSHFEQTTSESAKRIEQSLVTVADSTAKLTNQLNGAAEKTVSAIEGMVAHIEAIKVPEDLIETKVAPIASAVAKTVSAIEGTVPRIEAIKVPEDLIEAKVAPIASAFAKTVTEIQEEASKGSEEFQQLFKTLSSASGAAARLEEGVTTVTRVIENLIPLTDTLNRAEKRLGALTNGLDDIGKALADGGSAWRNVLTREAEGMKTTLDAACQTLTKAAGEFHDSISKPAREAGSALTAIAQQRESLQKIEENFRQLTKTFETQVASLPAEPDRSWWRTVIRFFNLRASR